MADQPIESEPVAAGELRVGDTVSAFGFTGPVRVIEDVPGSPQEIVLRFRSESEPLRLHRSALVKRLRRTPS